MLIHWLENYSKDINFIPVLHTPDQTSGVGQKDRVWKSDEGSLTFSFILAPQIIPTWTPLEMALLVRSFIQKKFTLSLQLKWPNDLVDSQGKKYGGIICHMRKNKVVIGIGLNVFNTYKMNEQNDDQYFPGYILENSKVIDLISVLHELIEFICSHRYQDAKDISTDWLTYCAHHKKNVCIKDNHQFTEGVFLGLGDFGEAKILDKSGAEIKVTNGSLTFDKSSNSN